MQVRIEHLAHGTESLQPVAAQGVLELLGDGVERCALGDVAVLASQLHVVQDTEQGGQDLSDGCFLTGLGLGLDPSAGVDVVRLLPLELLGELGDPALELGDPTGVGRSGVTSSLRRLLEELGRLGVDRVDRIRGLS